MSSKKQLSRRGFIRGVGAGGGVFAAVALEENAAAQPAAPAKITGPGPVPVTLNVNGKAHNLTLEPPVIGGIAAIANAVTNAIGVRPPVVPLTPDKVLAALEGRKA